MSEHSVCIHGHFYQPPRENPWLERIELQESAYPYHDWNQRITAECYGPNARSRILDDDGRINRIVNNYARISFNVGPTLLSWMEVWAPEVYAAVLQADHQSRELFDGHGSAIAQAYNHLIMPLSSQRDRVTQVRWGIVDFAHRFGRTPEGMWLPETAVDLTTLAILAEHGILYTVLAPHQAAAVRRLGDDEWTDVKGGKVDPSMPYRVMLPSGQSIVVFFYDGPISRGVAFEGLLNDGARFARRLNDGFSERDGPQLVHIATDGESYGHHHRHGDMALSYATCELGTHGDADLTNYGAFLAKFPPTHEAEILENTSWSCAHGIERWRGDCGCKTGGHLDWHQAWRRPLRDALDWLRDELAETFERVGAELLEDAWVARDAYIDVILDRTPETIDRFVAEHAVGTPDAQRRVRILQLLEMQRHAMLMYTSCGWFFDDVSRIETVQILRYAARAIQLAESVGATSPEEGFLDRLTWARSNDPDQHDGRRIYETQVKASMASLEKVAAHYSMRSLFEAYEEKDTVYCYDVERDEHQTLEAGRAKLGVGRVRVTSQITGASALLSFAVVHLGDHTLTGGVRPAEIEAHQAMVAEITAAFKRAEITEVVRLFDRHFDGRTFSLSSLFRDAQHRILNTILASTTDEVEAVYHQLYEQHAPLMRFLGHLGLPVPGVLHSTGEQVLNSSLRRAFAAETMDLEEVHRLLDDAREAAIDLDREGLSFALETSLERLVARLETQQGDAATIQDLTDAVSMARALHFKVDLTRVETAYYEVVREIWQPTKERAEAGDERAAVWLERMRALADLLRIRVG